MLPMLSPPRSLDVVVISHLKEGRPLSSPSRDRRLLIDVDGQRPVLALSTVIEVSNVSGFLNTCVAIWQARGLLSTTRLILFWYSFSRTWVGARFVVVTGQRFLFCAYYRCFGLQNSIVSVVLNCVSNFVCVKFLQESGLIGYVVHQVPYYL